MSRFSVTHGDQGNGSRPVSRGPCDHCGSSDGLVLFSDGHSYCFVHNQYYPSTDDSDNEGYRRMSNNDTQHSASINGGGGEQKPLLMGYFTALKDRAISKDTCEKYGVRVVSDASGKVLKHLYPYHDKNGVHVSNKIRVVETKEFQAQPMGSLGRAGLFGEYMFNGGGKYVTLCEGELDALSAYEMLGSKWPVVSIKDGAQSAVRNCKASYNFLNSYENIVICFDNDEHGKKAAVAVAEIFEPNKCKIINMSLKDANEYIKNGRREEFVRAWWDARVYTPAGIINLKDYGEALYDEGQQQTCLYPFAGLNEKLYGIRTGELVTLTAGTGTGKSSVMRELMHHVLNNTKENIGVLSLEENVRSTIFHLMSVEANSRLYIREVRERYPRVEMDKWYKSTVGTGRFFAFDHFGSLGTEEILARVRYMIKALDCKWIFLDHLSILVSGLEGMDERRNIDILMTKLRSLVEETNCALLLVSHLRRTGADSGHEDGKEVSLAHLRGSQSIAQLSDAVIAMERDQQADDPNVANTTTIRVLKNRYAGETGIACHLFFNKETGRLHEVENLGDSDTQSASSNGGPDL